MKITITDGNTKLGKVHNISLPPGPTGTCRADAPCAKRCYAMKSWRMYPDTREAWQANLDAWNTDPMGYMEHIAGFCATHRVERFRWHVAGDIPSTVYHRGMCLVAECNPETRFLAFTKNENIVDLKRPENLRIIFSMWPGLKVNPVWLESRVPMAWLQPATADGAAYETLCNEVTEGAAMPCSGHCDDCFMCWYLEPGMHVMMKEH